METYRKCVALFVFSALTTSCYIEGGGCNGPVCFGVSTVICDGGICNNSDNANAHCPDADDIQLNSRAAINRASSVNNHCGVLGSGSTASAQWDMNLFTAADLHSLDMATNNFVSPLGSDGLGLTDRLSGIGFTYAAQSVAAGFKNANELINGWLSDARECNKILNPAISGFALACRYDGDSQYGTYWTLVMTGS